MRFHAEQESNLEKAFRENLWKKNQRQPRQVKPAVPTHKQSLDALFALVGAQDDEAATAAITSMRNFPQSIYAALGNSGDVPENFDFAGAISALVHAQQEIVTTLGVPDFGAAIPRIQENAAAAANWNALCAELGTKENPVTDLAAATQVISGLRSAATDFENKVRTEVVRRAASAGVPEALPKTPPQEQQGAKTMSRADWRTLSPHEQSNFLSSGGRITD